MKRLGVDHHKDSNYPLLISALAHSELSRDEVLKLKWKQLNDAKMDEKLLRKMNNMHTNFYIGAVRGLLGAVGAEIYRSKYYFVQRV